MNLESSVYVKSRVFDFWAGGLSNLGSSINKLKNNNSEFLSNISYSKTDIDFTYADRVDVQFSFSF